MSDIVFSYLTSPSKSPSPSPSPSSSPDPSNGKQHGTKPLLDFLLKTLPSSLGTKDDDDNDDDDDNGPQCVFIPYLSSYLSSSPSSSTSSDAIFSELTMIFEAIREARRVIIRRRRARGKKNGKRARDEERESDNDGDEGGGGCRFFVSFSPFFSAFTSPLPSIPVGECQWCNDSVVSKLIERYAGGDVVCLSPMSGDGGGGEYRMDVRGRGGTGGMRGEEGGVRIKVDKGRKNVEDGKVVWSV